MKIYLIPGNMSRFAPASGSWWAGTAATWPAWYIFIFFVFTGMGARAQFSLEMNAGNKALAVYIKDFQYLDNKKKMSFYSNNRFAVQRDSGEAGFFSFNKLAWHFPGGIGLAAMMLAGNGELHPAAGLQFQQSAGPFSFSFLSSFELGRCKQQDTYFNLSCEQPLSRKLSFIFYNENYACLVNWNYTRSFERIKTGLEVHRTQLGFFSETQQTGKKHKTSLVNLGVFIRQSF